MSARRREVVSRFLSLLIIAVATTAVHAVPIQWTIASGGNGHYYDVVPVPTGISWLAANAAASASGGYLATVTSSAEGGFVYNNLVNNAAYWNQEPGGSNLGPWLGGYQTSDNGSQPAANWTWVTGETWSYTNWASGEPNNFTGVLENYLSYKCWGTPGCRSDKWNDLPDSVSKYGTPVIAYVIEYDDPTAVQGGRASGPAMRVFPNPFSSSTSVYFVAPGAGAVDVGIFDVSGRLVRRIAARTSSGDERRVEWDGRTDDGELAPTGVYFCRLKLGSGTHAKPILLLR
jgi:hypothetical protein